MGAAAFVLACCAWPGLALVARARTNLPWDRMDLNGDDVLGPRELWAVAGGIEYRPATDGVTPCTTARLRHNGWAVYTVCLSTMAAAKAKQGRG